MCLGCLSLDGAESQTFLAPSYRNDSPVCYCTRGAGNAARRAEGVLVQAKRWFVGLMVVVASAFAGCAPGESEQAPVAEQSAELSSCAGQSQRTCSKALGCQFLTGCCGGMCVDQGQTCPIACPPPEGLAPTTCGERPQSTCTKSAGCEFLTGCCDGLCVEQGQTCPIVCPPPEA